MPSNSEIILSAQTHPDGSTVETVTGTKFKGDGYYGRSDGLHTLQIDLTDFVGKIEVQGTLAIDPAEEDWFVVNLGTGNQSVDTTGLIREENVSYIEQLTAQTTSSIYNFTGNYVWVRTKVTNWSEGTINSIRLNH